VVDALENYAEELATRLDRVEERILEEVSRADRETIGEVRRMTVRLHRQLVIMRSLIHRFEHGIDKLPEATLALETAKLSQRLDWLDTEIVELRDRARLLQEETMLKDAEQTNRSLHVLATVTTVFLPATLVAGIFGMNVGGLPWEQTTSGFLWAMAVIVVGSALVYWLLKRSGMTGR
jgi:Mg2+ and Co2+ transporter CorA